MKKCTNYPPASVISFTQQITIRSKIASNYARTGRFRFFERRLILFLLQGMKSTSAQRRSIPSKNPQLGKNYLQSPKAFPRLSWWTIPGVIFFHVECSLTRHSSHWKASLIHFLQCRMYTSGLATYNRDRIFVLLQLVRCQTRGLPLYTWTIDR